MKNILANNRYKVCSGYDASKLIEQGLKKSGYPLNTHQARALRDYFGDSGMLGNLDMPFQLYTWEKEKLAGSFKWRLTVPFFWIFGLLYMITIYPIHWIITGKETLDYDNPVAKFISAWDNKLFTKHYDCHRTEY